MLFSLVDEIEEKIALLGFYVKAKGSESKLEIKGLQVMEGWAIFELDRNVKIHK